VLELLEPAPGERAWDLYGGAGLFSAVLADAVGPTGAVTLVESDRSAVAAARDSLADLANVHVVRSNVERFRPADEPDVVVLDPPRRGAGAAVVRALVAAAPRAVAYVACDPAAFARDVATFRAAGWRLAALRAFDAFPMTHHVECVGLLVP
jgi:tRNA/tmRNA/rRNA uracil-C5-methylase (TrmA/RlmC/RlmD family)